MVRFLLLLLFLWTGNALYALPASLFFQNITTANGLSHNKVNCILQDSRGFMWIGTDDGLNRYDGNRFVIFRNQPATRSGPSGNIITCLLEDKSGILWIATADGGLTRYDHRLSPLLQFRQYRHSPEDSLSIPANTINAIIEDRLGHLWLGSSERGLFRFNKQTERFDIPITNMVKTILSLSIDQHGMIWAGRQGGGLIRMNPDNFTMEIDEAYHDVYRKLPHMVVTSLFRDSRNNMWYGSWDKVVYRYNDYLKKEEVFKRSADPFSFPEDDPISFAEDGQFRIWIGGTYHGLYIYDGKENRFHNYSHDPSREGTLINNRVNCIYRDRSGMIWLGTKGGLSLHNPSQQQFTQNFLAGNSGSNVMIYDFFQDDEGKLWIGTSEGIYLRNGKGETRLIPLTYNNQKLAVTKFFLAQDKQFYIGTNYSLFRLNPQNFKIELLPNTDKDIVMNRIIESRVVSITEDTIDGHPVLMVSPYGHYLAYYDFVSRQWVSRKDSIRRIIQSFDIRDHLIRKFYKTSSGKIWMTTTQSGLGEWMMDPGPKIRYHYNIPGKPGTISNNYVYDMIEDREGNLWVSAYGGGLHYFKAATGEFRQLPASHNLAEGIQLDSDGNPWIIANGHLHKYDIRRGSYITFSLPDIERSGGVHGNIYKNKEGRMFVAGLNYFIEFAPEKVRELIAKPKVYLTDFRIFNNSWNHLLASDRLQLKHDQNFFSVEFAAPYFQGPVYYSYKLEGVNPDWIELGPQTLPTANYTNLNGGNYVFKVRATSRPGIWEQEIATIPIRIIPPFWKTWWFFLVCLVFIIGTVYLAYRYRINELLKRQAIRNKIAQDLHDNVGSTLSSISVYSQVAKIYHERDKQDELQQTLYKISSASGEMISEMNDIVWTINPRNDSMEKILQRMESFAKPLLHTQNIQFSFRYDPEVMHLNLEMDKRKNFYLIFKEAINNALKYAACNKLEVKVCYEYNHIELTVADDGVGFDQLQVNSKTATSLSGNGLRNMQMRVKEMKGILTIQSAPGLGTVVNLRFPASG